MKKNDHIHFMMTTFLNLWDELNTYLIKNPDVLHKSQVSFWQAYQTCLQESSQNNLKDKRFTHNDWQQNVTFNVIKTWYQFLCHYIENIINNTMADHQDDAKKINFFAHQFLDAISPTNFAYLNPEVLDELTKTNGDNITQGFKQFFADSQDGRLNMKTTDTHTFEIGKNIACTKGDVIFQNELMQLIRYHASTDKIYDIPILMIPPWINKYYILDLQPENSFVRWLINQGFSVYMISWVNPTFAHKNKKFIDYMRDGPLTAMNIINEMEHAHKVNLLGYCIGGTLLACLLAYLAKKNDERVMSATFLTTLLDFKEPGELKFFIDEQQILFLEENMKTTGYLDGRVLATAFSMLRARDLIWNPFINNYLKGQKPKSFDLLYWNSDATNIPAKVYSFYIRNMYIKNLLIQKKIKLDDVRIDLGNITIPSYFVAAKDDHIVPWQTCYHGSSFLKGVPRFILAESGHVAGIINPPQKNKYGFRVHEGKHVSEQLIEELTFIQGSWWQDWVKWLLPHSGALRNKKRMKQANVLEEAPGSYVKVKL